MQEQPNEQPDPEVVKLQSEIQQLKQKIKIVKAEVQNMGELQNKLTSINNAAAARFKDATGTDLEAAMSVVEVFRKVILSFDVDKKDG